MHLLPREVSYDALLSKLVCADSVWQLDKIVISQVGCLAQRRLARGVKLNHVEATVYYFLSDEYGSNKVVQALLSHVLHEVCTHGIISIRKCLKAKNPFLSLYAMAITQSPNSCPSEKRFLGVATSSLR